MQRRHNQMSVVSLLGGTACFPQCSEMNKRPKAFTKGVCPVCPHSSIPCQLASHMVFLVLSGCSRWVTCSNGKLKSIFLYSGVPSVRRFATFATNVKTVNSFVSKLLQVPVHSSSKEAYIHEVDPYYPFRKHGSIFANSNCMSSSPKGNRSHCSECDTRL